MSVAGLFRESNQQGGLGLFSDSDAEDFQVIGRNNYTNETPAQIPVDSDEGDFEIVNPLEIDTKITKTLKTQATEDLFLGLELTTTSLFSLLFCYILEICCLVSFLANGSVSLVFAVFVGVKTLLFGNPLNVINSIRATIDFIKECKKSIVKKICYICKVPELTFTALGNQLHSEICTIGSWIHSTMTKICDTFGCGFLITVIPGKIFSVIGFFARCIQYIMECMAIMVKVFLFLTPVFLIVENMIEDHGIEVSRAVISERFGPWFSDLIAEFMFYSGVH